LIPNGFPPELRGAVADGLGGTDANLNSDLYISYTVWSV